MIKKLVNRVLAKLFNVELSKIKSKKKRSVLINKQNLLFEEDNYFNSLYDEGIKKTGTPLDNGSIYFSKRRVRFYNTVQFFLQTMNKEGDIIELGCFKGLSSFIFCNYAKKLLNGYVGSNYTIVDSFEGLSEPSPEDALSKDENGKDKFFVEAGHFSTPLEKVKSALIDFPEVSFVKGWIPQILSELPERKYKFVHLDVDLYSPILGSLEYFYPRLTESGMIVVDDFGSLYWPGAKKAVEEFCERNQINFLTISTAQAIIYKK